MLCDCPGLEDSRGPELDIANIYGVVHAAWGCKAIIPIIILSEGGMGERMSSFKKISQAIANLFKNPKRDMQSLHFLFTKYLLRKDE